MKEKLNILLNSTLGSYSQIFFSNNKIFSLILIFISFFDIWAGVFGLTAVLFTNSIALIFSFNKYNIKTGYYGFNSLLVGLGVGLVFVPTYKLLIIVFLLSALTLFLCIAIEGILTKYSLPFLSIPFLFSIWIILLASMEMTRLGLVVRTISVTTSIFSFDIPYINSMISFLDTNLLFCSLKIYFLSLGSIFFQYNILAGIFISIGLLIYSRIGFSLSLIGFYSAFLFYHFIGVEITNLSYDYIGFNFILTAIALGGFFIVPSKYSYLWVAILLPIVVLLTISLNKIFFNFQLSIYSLPFNIMVILFVYILNLRLTPQSKLINKFTQFYSPEKNLYFHINNMTRFKGLLYNSLSLPFFGKWTVSQAHDGKYTHKEEWRHAWDFNIVNDEDKQYKASGSFLDDYYCYNKSVLSPANGVVQDIVDRIPDNLLGEKNTNNNWGNSIVIKHNDYLFTQISHIKTNSFKVSKGDNVKKGQILAVCGNSGHSPFPHIHFQIQATPFIGSHTLKYPISNFIIHTEDKFEYKDFEYPVNKQVISNIQPNIIIKRALNFIPGQQIICQIIKNDLQEKIKSKEYIWIVQIDIYKNTYLHCEETNSYAYYKSENNVFKFTSYIGSKKNLLYYFYLAYQKVQYGYYDKMTVNDMLPVNLFFSKKLLFFQDFIAPFYIFLKSRYKIRYANIDNELVPKQIKIKSSISNYIFKRQIKQVKFDITLHKTTKSKIVATENNKQIEFDII